ncbi:MAG: dTDP-glucose 4,6-dehydratase [Muribaculaceae bacterium]
MSNTYFVTGAAGFIGANFVNHLIDKYSQNVEITIFDSLTYAGNLESIASLLQLPNVRFVKADICDPVAVAEALAHSNPDFIVNFAAESHVDRSIENPKLFLETNIIGTQTLLEAARRLWCEGSDEVGRPKYRSGVKFLQISTDEVYGSLAKDFDTPQPLHLTEDVGRVVQGRDHLITYGWNFFVESTPLAPRSPYSASKTSADLIVLAYRETYGLPINITRCSNNYGPYQFPEKLIPLIINNILTGKKLPVYGKGENVRDWLYVEDHARAIDIVLRNGTVGEVYNVGGFNEESNINIVRLIIDIVHRLCVENPEYARLSAIPVEDINYDLITFVADRPGHDMRYAIDPGKIARQLGWYPETPFAIGIEKTVKWYLDNREWVNHVTSGEYADYYSKMYDNR